MYTFAFVSISSQRAKRNQSESERNVYAPLHSEKSLTLMGGLPKEMNGKPQDKSPRSAICNSNCQPTNVGLWTLFVAPSNYRNTMENHPFPAPRCNGFPTRLRGRQVIVTGVFQIAICHTYYLMPPFRIICIRPTPAIKLKFISLATVAGSCHRCEVLWVHFLRGDEVAGAHQLGKMLGNLQHPPASRCRGSTWRQFHKQTQNYEPMETKKKLEMEVEMDVEMGALRLSGIDTMMSMMMPPTGRCFAPFNEIN